MKYVIPAIMVTLILAPTIWFLTVYPDKAQKVPRTYVEWNQLVDDDSQVLEYEITVPTRHFEKEAYPIKVLERVGNIKVNFNSIEPSEYARKKDLMLATGNVPEIFDMEAMGVARYAKQNVLAPVPLNMLKKYCPSYVKLVNKYAPYIWLGGTYEGENFGIPLLWISSQFPRTGVWRKDWLENVEIYEVPETLDEMEEAFRRFREEDPDGNGKKDTYALSGDMENWYALFTEVFGAYGVMPFNWMLNEEDEFVYGGVQPEAKLALKRLRSWFEKGYLHPEFQTDKWYREVNQKFTSGKVGYVNYMASYESFDPNNPQSNYNKIKANGGEIIPAILPKGPNGDRGHRVWGAGVSYKVFSKKLLEKPEKIIRYLKVIERFMSNEQDYIEFVLGKQGVHWDWRMEGENNMGAMGLKGTFDDEEVDYGLLETRNRHGLGQFIFVERANLHVAYLDFDQSDKYLNPNKVKFRNTYTPKEWGIQDLLGKPNMVSKTNSILTRLRQKQIRVYVEIIIGQSSLDEFDDFVKEWYEEGGQELLDASRDYYNDYKEIAEQMQIEEVTK